MVAALVLIAALVVGGRRARERRLGQRRRQAEGLRETAAEGARRADEREAVAREAAEQAQLDRSRAEEATRRAAEVDPDRDE